MLVHAFVAAVGTCPKPAVFAFFDGVDEVFADFVGCGFWVAVLVEDDLAEFLCMFGSLVSGCLDKMALGRLMMLNCVGIRTRPYLHPSPPYHLFSSQLLPPPPLYLDKDFSSLLSAPPPDRD